MRRFRAIWHNYQQRCDRREQLYERAWKNRRRKAIADRKRRQRLLAASPLERDRIERLERRRQEKLRDRYRGSPGVLMNINAALRCQQGGSTIWALLAVVFAALLLALFLLSLPAMMIMGFLGMFASKILNLPGIKLISNFILSITCSDAGKWIADKLGKGSIFSKLNPMKPISAAAGFIKDQVTNVLGNGLFVKIITFPLTATQTMGDLFEAVTEGAKNFHLMLCAIFGDKNSVLSSFKDKGGEKPFEAALSCANWDTATMGSLDSTEKFTLDSTMTGMPASQGGGKSIMESNSGDDGERRFCKEAKQEKDNQGGEGKVPNWLIGIYQAAAAEYDVPWELLAAINWNDTNYGGKEMSKAQKDNKLKVDTKYSEDMVELKKIARKPGSGTRGPNGILRNRGMSDDEVKASPIAKQLMPSSDPKDIREQAKQAVETATQVNSIWQVPDPDKKQRAGWIPFSPSEWKEARDDQGGVPLDWQSSPYKKTLKGSPQACPGPVDVDGNLAIGNPMTAAEGDNSELKGPFTGIATVYDPREGGINGKEGGGSFTATYGKGYAVAKLGNPENIPGWNYPKDNQAYHGWLLRITNEANGKSIEVPVSDIGPGNKTAPANDSLAQGFEPKGKLPRVLDLLPNVARQLNDGTKDNLKVKFEPIKKLSKEETAKYSRGDKKAKATDGGGAGDPGASVAEVDVSFKPDGDTDTCDPVDSIFALAKWLSKRGARGDTWRGALENDVGNIDETKPIPGSTGGPSFVEGDSLSVMAKKQIFKRFGKNLEKKNFDAKEGRQVTTGIERIKARKSKLPNTLIFALGANMVDIKDSVFRGWIDQVMDIAGESRCVVWPTVYEHGPHFVSVLHKAEKKYDNLVVVDWHSIAEEHVGPDRVHFEDDSGADAYARLLERGAAKCVSVAPAPKAKGITGKEGEMVLEGTSKRPIMYSGATNFGTVFRNKPGEIPRKGGIVKIDPDDPPEWLPACFGGVGTIEKDSHRKYASQRYPGVAVKIRGVESDSHANVCGYWLITAPNGKSMKVMQIDKGPGGSGDHLDINSTLAQELGYKTGNEDFPSNQGVWRAEYLGKHRPDDVNKLIGGRGKPADALQKRIKDRKVPKEFKPDSIPPLVELKKPNPKLPDAAWVHAPAKPLKSKFPSFDTGLVGARDGGSACGTVPPAKQNGVFFAAEKAFKIPWQLLAAYAAVTSRYGCDSEDAYSLYKGSYATDADGNGVFQPSDPVDSTFSTARSLYALGGKEKLAEAARAMTKDKEMLAEVAELASQLGLATPGFYQLMDDAISGAVQKRDHTMDKELCADSENYVECIAELYRQIKGEQGGEGKYITGGCADDSTVPDVNLEPFTDKKWKAQKTVKGVFNAVNNTKGRVDAQKGYEAVMRTWIDCHPEWKKKWKEISSNDWNAPDHASHQNGADHDSTIPGVSSGFTGTPGTPGPGADSYDRKKSLQLATMFLRAGAVAIFFDDPWVQKESGKIRAEDEKENKDAVKRLKKEKLWWAGPNPVDWAYDGGAAANQKHHNHFHVRWHNSDNEDKNANVKVWLTDSPGGGSGGDEEEDSGTPYDVDEKSGVKAATEVAKERLGKVAFAYISESGQMEGYGLSSNFYARGLAAIAIATRYLQEKGNGKLSGEEKDRLQNMMVNGKAEDTKALFDEIGGTSGLEEVVSDLNLNNFNPEDNWQETGVTPANMAKLFGSALNLVPNKHSDTLRNLLEETTSATDWGIPKGWETPKWGLGKAVGMAPVAKEGRSARGGERKPTVSQCAIEGPRKSLTVICVLTEKNPSVDYGKETVEEIAYNLNPENNASSCEGYPLGKKGKVGQGPNQRGGTHDPNADPDNWQSDNALDILVDRNTPVLATGDGTIVKVSGSAPKPGGDRFAGFAITLKTSDNQIFYTHLMSVKVKAGDKVKQGDEIGKSGYAADVDHLHIGVEKGDPSKMFDCGDADGGSGSGGGDKGGGKDDGSKKSTKNLELMAKGQLPKDCSTKEAANDSSCIALEQGPVYFWCQWHYASESCNLVINKANWTARIRAILKKEGCTQFKRGACGKAADALALQQAFVYKNSGGAKGAAKGEAKIITEVRPSDVTGAAAPSGPYTPK